MGRLVRGLGASTSDSRTGFYSALVALLSTVPSDGYPTITNLFEIMETKLSVSGGNNIEKVSANLKLLRMFVLN